MNETKSHSGGGGFVICQGVSFAFFQFLPLNLQIFAIYTQKSASFDECYQKYANFDNFFPQKCNFGQFSTSENEKYGEIFSHFFYGQGKK